MNKVKPVAFPPGRGRLATKPEPTGSITPTNTIGTIGVARFSASTAAVVAARMTLGARVTNSVAYLR